MTPEEFRTARLAAGLSIRKAAAALGCWPGTIQRWEKGERRIPSEAADNLRNMRTQQDAWDDYKHRVQP